MRTTLTLEDDVAAQLQELSRQSRKSFKHVVNEVIRLGLKSRRDFAPRRAFKIKPFKARLRPGINLDCTSALVEQIEGEMHR